MSAALLVADSGPLIALARLQRLDLPARLFGAVLVPALVWEEVTREPPADEGARLRHALADGSLRVVADAELPVSASLGATLDPGEQSAIAVALRLEATVLIDERRGRASAAALGLQVLGTLGLLVRARDAGLVEQLRPLAEALTRSGYFLAPELVERVLAAVGE